MQGTPAILTAAVLKKSFPFPFTPVTPETGFETSNSRSKLANV